MRQAAYGAKGWIAGNQVSRFKIGAFPARASAPCVEPQRSKGRSLSRPLVPSTFGAQHVLHGKPAGIQRHDALLWKCTFDAVALGLGFNGVDDGDAAFSSMQGDDQRFNAIWVLRGTLLA